MTGDDVGEVELLLPVVGGARNPAVGDAGADADDEPAPGARSIPRGTLGG